MQVISKCLSSGRHEFSGHAHTFRMSSDTSFSSPLLAEQQKLPSHASMKSWGRLIWNFRIFQRIIHSQYPFFQERMKIVLHLICLISIFPIVAEKHLLFLYDVFCCLLI